MDTTKLIISFSLMGFGVASVLNLLAYRLKDKTTMFLVSFIIFAASTGMLGISVFSSYAPEQTLNKASIILAFILSIFAIVGHLKFKMKTITTFIAPVSTLILIIQSYVNPIPIFPENAHLYSQKFLTAHILLAICGQSFGIITSGVAITFLWQQKNLKQRLLNSLSSDVPALDRLDWMLTTSLWLGFSFLTAGLISGAIYSSIWGSSTGNGFKIAWALVVWFWYFVTILTHTVFKQSIKTTAKMTLLGFILLATTFFGIFAISSVGSF